ncbi:hypothetical protein COLO4_19698 [Corchorus olitorius]|uniref:Myb-like domain-containing protein n=1 Tax=Corchorus olitorius TaxID=93759 RepID=A0A1R3J400_9ROSI|nr:hypothetical protein COLO4_19698 [Corchorus olitorius]
MRTKTLCPKPKFCTTSELSSNLSTDLYERDGVNQEKQDNVTEKVKASGVSTMEGKINADDCEKGLNDDHSERIHHNREEALSVESISKEKSDEESTSRVGDGERTQEEDIENTSDSEDDKIDEDQWRKQPSSSNHLEIVRGPRRSTEETSNVVGVLEENQGKKGNEEPGLSNAVGTTMTLIAKNATSKVPAIEHFEYVSPNLDTLDIEPLAVRAKRFKRPAQRPRPQKVDSPKNPSSQSSSSAEHEKMNRQEKATAAKDSLRCQKLTRQLMLPTLGEKRRRLNWTAEEVDMLKEGVRIFSAEANKNIPWRKILLFGHRVFHETRAPADLKDKWKNMAKAPKAEARIHDFATIRELKSGFASISQISSISTSSQNFLLLPVASSQKSPTSSPPDLSLEDTKS